GWDRTSDTRLMKTCPVIFRSCCHEGICGLYSHVGKELRRVKLCGVSPTLPCRVGRKRYILVDSQTAPDRPLQTAINGFCAAARRISQLRKPSVLGFRFHRKRADVDVTSRLLAHL